MTWTVTLAIGIILSVTGAFLGVREHVWLRHAPTGSGTVVELIASRGSGRRISYTPRVQYVASDGSKRLLGVVSKADALLAFAERPTEPV